ncbi:hypothetical protein LG315_10985 [Microbacterium marinum]|uniref:hypothetical protein n=1 Tax=Microbacterium marinum TaxID=421115 RepID=UPI00384CA6D0
MPAPVRLAFGAADYYADLGLPYQSSGTHTELAMATLVLAYAAAGLPSPVASITVDGALVDEAMVRHARSIL